VKRVLDWTRRNLLLVALVGGTGVALVGVTIAVAAITSRYLGTWPAVGFAATVAGAGTARAALAWSRLTVVEEATK
jgi:hypothetical protein